MSALVDFKHLMLLCIPIALGCEGRSVEPMSHSQVSHNKLSWHQRVRWRAENYFDDPRVIALCSAIEADDLIEMKRLIQAGTNVNARGKGNMTPLLWAFFDNKPTRFKLLLEHGADPNVIFTSSFGVKALLLEGMSVTHIASSTRFPGYFEAVFDHGGDPNLLTTKRHHARYSPLHEVIYGPSARKRDKIFRLIELGADVNAIDGSEDTPCEAAAGRGQFELVIELLNAGADHNIYASNSNRQLIHDVLIEERSLPRYSQKQQADYKKLLVMLKDRGVDIEAARADLARWSAPGLPGSYREMMNKEVAERKAREAR